MRKLLFLFALCLPVVSSYAQLPSATLLDVRARGAVGDGQADDTNALQNTLDQALRLCGATVYLPRGTFRIHGNLRLDARRLAAHPACPATTSAPLEVRISGEGEGVSRIVQSDPNATLLTLRGDYDVFPSLDHLSLLGRGPQTNGNLLEDLAPSTRVEQVLLGGTAGRCLLQDAERLLLRDVRFLHCRQALVQGSGATNESYYYGIEVLGAGIARDLVGSTPDFNFNRNAHNGVFPSDGPVQPDFHAAIVLGYNAVNNLFEGGSIKPLGRSLAGIRVFGGENIRFSHLYLEGYDTPALNPSLIIGGPVETTSATSPIPADARVFSVADSSWMINRLGSDLDLDPDGDYSMILYPPDYQLNSREPSQLGSGIRRGDFEQIYLSAYTGNQAHIVHRAVNGTQVHNWPRGVLVAESRGRSVLPMDPVIVEDCHLAAREHNQRLPGQYTIVASPDQPLVLAEVVLGIFADRFHTWATGSASDYTGSFNRLLELSGNTRMRTGDAGQGTIAVVGAGVVLLEHGGVADGLTAYGSTADAIRPVRLATGQLSHVQVASVAPTR